MEPQPQIHFGHTKSLENVSSSHKCRMQVIFLLSTGDPAESLDTTGGTLKLHRTLAEKHWLTQLDCVVYGERLKTMAGNMVPSDSTHAMASLVSAYGDDEFDDDAVRDTSGISASLENDAAISPDTRTQQAAAANFISDDEEPHLSPQETNDVDNKQSTTSTKSPSAEQRPAERTSKYAGDGYVVDQKVSK